MVDVAVATAVVVVVVLLLLLLLLLLPLLLMLLLLLLLLLLLSLLLLLLLVGLLSASQSFTQSAYLYEVVDPKIALAGRSGLKGDNPEFLRPSRKGGVVTRKTRKI